MIPGRAATPDAANFVSRPRRGGAVSFLCSLLLAAALSGCASPVGVLQPVARGVPGATLQEILVVTTRAPSPDGNILFSGERGDPAFLNIAVSIPPEGRQIGRVQWPRRTPPDPETEFAVSRIEPLKDVSRIEDVVGAHAGEGRRVVVFIHGFNTRFEQALFSFAQIMHDSGAGATPVLFSWPSRGSLLEYSYDRESASVSRDALEKLLTRLAESPQIREVTVLAHSMGAWLAMETLRQLAIRRGRTPERIRNVVLASPDIDVDVFRAQLVSLGQKRPRIMVLVSRRDRALQLSRSIAGNIERLGAADPGEKAWIAEKGVEVVDLTDVHSGDLTRHSKFAANPDVVRFLGAQVINGETPGDPEGRVGNRLGGAAMGLAQGVAGVTGLALGAPIAVLDPETRGAYSSQIEQVRDAVDNAVASAAGR